MLDIIQVTKREMAKYEFNNWSGDTIDYKKFEEWRLYYWLDSEDLWDILDYYNIDVI